MPTRCQVSNPFIHPIEEATPVIPMQECCVCQSNTLGNQFVIRDKFCRGSPETYIVFVSVDELFGELHGVDVDHISVHTNGDLATSATIVDGRCIAVEFVSSNWFSPLDYIRNRIL